MTISNSPTDLKHIIKSLQANFFDVHLAQTKAEARTKMLAMIPDDIRVGVGCSSTLMQIGILDSLTKRGNEVVNPFNEEYIHRRDDPAVYQRFLDTAREALKTDIFLASANAVTKNGKIVNTDRVGNRVAGTIFAVPWVIMPIGINKIVNGLHDAAYRTKNVISPIHTAYRGRKTPCAALGKCTDCAGPTRICNITVILEKKPLGTNFSVILVNEDLGLSYDPAWDEKRIDKIKSNYRQNMMG